LFISNNEIWCVFNNNDLIFLNNGGTFNISLNLNNCQSTSSSFSINIILSNLKILSIYPNIISNLINTPISIYIDNTNNNNLNNYLLKIYNQSYSYYYNITNNNNNIIIKNSKIDNFIIPNGISSGNYNISIENQYNNCFINNNNNLIFQNFKIISNFNINSNITSQSIFGNNRF
jgi:hypothetical protein